MSIAKVTSFIEEIFLPRMKIYEHRHLSGHELTRSMIGRQTSHTFEYETLKEGEVVNLKDDISFLYGTKNYPDPLPDYPTPVHKVKIKSYNDNSIGFMETPKFWMDMVLIGERLGLVPPTERLDALSNWIREEINPNLPATVYVPFFTNMTRLFTILNVWEGRVFSTKERAPFSLWIEMYREEEEQIKEIIEDINEEEE